MAPTAAERRDGLLDEYFALWDRREDVRRRRLATSGQGPDLEAAADSILRRMQQLVNEYRDMLERYALSRCPFCAAPTVLSFDPHGIDGLYWNFNAPVRQIDPQPCPHFLVLAGAMKLAEPVKPVPMLVVPGPELPWVVPRLMETSTIRAVISQTSVGPHTAYPIAYFGVPGPKGSLVNAWGMNEYERVEPSGRRRWDEVTQTERDQDYEVARWLSQGRLSWIAPGDSLLTLHQDPAGFPYSGLSGRKGFVKVQDGLTWVYGWELDNK